MSTRQISTEFLSDLSERILLLDGDAYRAMVLKNFHLPYAEQLKFPYQCICNDPKFLLNLLKNYIEAGADIIRTPTLLCNRINLSEYKLAGLAADLNTTAVQIAREAVSLSQRRVYVAGVIGPTYLSGSARLVMRSVGETIQDDELEAELRECYYEQVQSLLSAGVDLLLAESIHDRVHLNAVLTAIEQGFHDYKLRLPVGCSFALFHHTGELLSGEHLLDILNEPCLKSVSKLAIIGIERGRDIPSLIRLVKSMPESLPAPIRISPNIDDDFPQCSEVTKRDSPQEHANCIRKFIDEGLVNIIGGSNSIDASHLSALSEMAKGRAPRKWE